jgi:chromosome segregation ATPase
MPTFWLSLVAVIGCIGAVVYQKRKPGEKEPAVTRKAKVSTPKPTYVASTGQVKSAEHRTVTATGQRITRESIREFTESYEDKKRLNAEIRSLDIRARKGKIPRRQYKVQRRAIEIRLETLSRNTSRMKETLRRSGSAYSDLIKQLDSAEEDLTEAEDNIKNLEDQQSRGEISIEAYKRNVGDYQKRRDKAESTLNGILLRLREKAR